MTIKLLNYGPEFGKPFKALWMFECVDFLVSISPVVPFVGKTVQCI